MSTYRYSWKVFSAATLGQAEFIQAVQEVAQDIYEFISDKEEYHHYQILRRIAEPDRIISCRASK